MRDPAHDGCCRTRATAIAAAIYAGDVARGGSGLVFAFDGGTGEELWRVDTRSVQFGDYTRVGINGSPAVVDGAVYVATAPSEVYAIR